LAAWSRTLGILDTISDTVVGAAQDGIASGTLSSELRDGSCKNQGELGKDTEEQDCLIDGRHLENDAVLSSKEALGL